MFSFDFIIVLDSFLFLLRSDAMLLLLILLVFSRLIYNRYFLEKDNEIAALLVLEDSKTVLFSICVAYFCDIFYSGAAVSWYYFNGLMFGSITLIYVKVFVAFFSLLVLLLAKAFFIGTGRGMVVEFPIFILFSVFSIFCILQARDLMLIALFMEMLSYCLFVMPVLYKFSNLSIEATVKYFILGSFSSCFLLMGVSLVFAAFGTTKNGDLQSLLFMLPDSFSNFPVDSGLSFFFEAFFFNIGFVFIFCALFFKLGLFPFHYWIRDVYEGSPLAAVSFFSTVAKIPVVIVLQRIYVMLISSSWSYGFFFTFLLQAVGISSILYGTFFAFYQSRVKSWFASTSIVHMGYVCLAISLPIYTGAFVVLNYVLTYCFSTMAVFFVIACFANKKIGIVRLTDFSIILRTHKNLALLFSIALLSAAGMPPFPGFFPKAFVIWAFLSNGDFLIAFFLMVANVANFVLYIRLIRFLYFFDFFDRSKDLAPLGKFDRTYVFAVALLLLFSVFFSIFIPIFFWSYIFIL